MRDAIEKVIAELERSSRVSMNLKKYEKADAYNAAVHLLKEVLAHEEIGAGRCESH